MSGWIGVDLDRTLAEYHGWVSAVDIGPPVPLMVARVRQWLREGKEVRIVTARIEAKAHVEAWCEKHIGVVLPVTDRKDYAMIELWDDRAVQVEPNTGVALLEAAQADARRWERAYEELLDSIGGVLPG